MDGRMLVRTTGFLLLIPARELSLKSQPPIDAILAASFILLHVSFSRDSRCVPDGRPRAHLMAITHQLMYLDGVHEPADSASAPSTMRTNFGRIQPPDKLTHSSSYLGIAICFHSALSRLDN